MREQLLHSRGGRIVVRQGVGVHRARQSGRRPETGEPHAVEADRKAVRKDGHVAQRRVSKLPRLVRGRATVVKSSRTEPPQYLNNILLFDRNAIN